MLVCRSSCPQEPPARVGFLKGQNLKMWPCGSGKCSCEVLAKKDSGDSNS